jgi:hypothetical protein
VLSTLLPLVGCGRRIAPSVRLQLLVLAQATCYAVEACHFTEPVPGVPRAARAAIAWRLLPGVYAPVGCAAAGRWGWAVERCYTH